MWTEGSAVLVNTDAGKRYVRVTIFGDSVPVSMPENGAEIDGLNADDILAKGCKFYCVGNGKIFILNGAGSWVEQ